MTEVQPMPLRQLVISLSGKPVRVLCVPLLYETIQL